MARRAWIEGGGWPAAALGVAAVVGAVWLGLLFFFSVDRRRGFISFLALLLEAGCSWLLLWRWEEGTARGFVGGGVAGHPWLRAGLGGCWC